MWKCKTKIQRLEESVKIWNAHIFIFNSTLYLAFLNTAKQCLLISILNSPACQRDSKSYSIVEKIGSEFDFYGNKFFCCIIFWRKKFNRMNLEFECTSVNLKSKQFKINILGLSWTKFNVWNKLNWSKLRLLYIKGQITSDHTHVIVTHICVILPNHGVIQSITSLWYYHGDVIL